MLSPPVGGIKSLHSFKKGALLHGCFAVMEPGAHIAGADEARPKALPVLPTFSVPSIEVAGDKAVELGGKVLV